MFDMKDTMHRHPLEPLELPEETARIATNITRRASL
jgi:hypothetical protein